MNQALDPLDPAGIVPVWQPATPEQVKRADEGGMRLSPGAAEAIRQIAKLPAVRKGIGGLGGKKDAWVVVLDPTSDTRKKLQAGEFVLTKTKKGGRLLAQARDAKTGQVAENISLKGVAEAGKGAKAAKVASAGVAVAWQAMAIATQQHYLVEISGKLSSIEAGVAEILERDSKHKAAELKTTLDALDLLERHIAYGDPLDSNDRQNVTRWHKDACTTHQAAVDHATKILGDPTLDPATALPDLVRADHAAGVAARCASTLLRMPFETEEKRLNVFWHYADLTDQALETVNDLVAQLDHARIATQTAWREYEAGRPRWRATRIWDDNAGKLKALRIGPDEPPFDGLRRLPGAHERWIQDRAELGRDGLEAVPATLVVDASGARLLPS